MGADSLVDGCSDSMQACRRLLVQAARSGVATRAMPPARFGAVGPSFSRTFAVAVPGMTESEDPAELNRRYVVANAQGSQKFVSKHADPLKEWSVQWVREVKGAVAEASEDDIELDDAEVAVMVEDAKAELKKLGLSNVEVELPQEVTLKEL